MYVYMYIPAPFFAQVTSPVSMSKASADPPSPRTATAIVRAAEDSLQAALTRLRPNPDDAWLVGEVQVAERWLQQAKQLNSEAAPTKAPPPAPRVKAVPKHLLAPSPDAPRVVAGVLPPITSGRNRRYYALRAHHPAGPVAAAGYPLALHYLNDNWFSHGRAPEGFFDLESAINSVKIQYPDLTTIPVLLEIPETKTNDVEEGFEVVDSPDNGKLRKPGRSGYDDCRRKA